MNADWQIKSTQDDWECDWAGSERFQLRYFKALSITEKIKAVEHMCETAQFFKTRALARQKSLGSS